MVDPNTNGDSIDPPEEILDEDGNVDTALKREIIKARTRVDETEVAVYRDAKIKPDVNLHPKQEVYIYATTVRLYLRRIEPILRVKNIANNKKYYREIELGSFELQPPDWEGYEFSLVSRDIGNETQLKQMLDLPQDVSLPEPEPVSITGLRDVIELEPILSHEWEVCVDNNGPPNKWEYVYPRVQQPVPKTVYEDAVRQADLFLQEAGIGLDTDISGSEIIDGFDMSGEEPSAEYRIGRKESNPDL